MAVVYLAEDERLDREVAVKRLHADSAEDVEIRFVREAKLGASLNHPNLVWVFDILTDEEGLVIVMEYVDGPHLGRELSSDRMQPRRAVEVLAATASALEHAHEHGVVHRDVKPANVLLGRDGTIKLADLGIATAADITRITRSDVALGTASYMAPEQLEGGRVSSATDLYALATVAFEMLSGAKARSGRTPMEVAHAISTEAPPDLREAWPAAPPQAAAVLTSAMARDPADRPASVCDFVSDLARALGEETTARMQLEAARAATGGAVAAPVSEPETEPEPEPTPTPTPEPTPARRRRGPRDAVATRHPHVGAVLPSACWRAQSPCSRWSQSPSRWPAVATSPRAPRARPRSRSKRAAGSTAGVLPAARIDAHRAAGATQRPAAGRQGRRRHRRPPEPGGLRADAARRHRGGGAGAATLG